MGKFLTAALGLLVLSGCIHAQPTVLPSGTVVGRISSTNAAGELLFPNNANIRCESANYATCKPLIIKNNAINGANLGAALTLTGATGTDGRILLNPGNVATKASVVVTSPSGNTSDPSVIVVDSTTGGAQNGISLKDSSGTQYMKLDSLGGFPTISLGSYGTRLRSTDFTMYSSTTAERAALLPGGTFGGGILQLFNSAGTFATGFTANPSMTSSAVYQLPIADGISGTCLSTNGSAVLSWTSCTPTSGANVFLSNLSSPTAVNQTLNMNSGTSVLWSTGTNLQTGQLGIWGGGVQRVNLSNGGAFGSGVLLLQNTAGDRFWGIRAALATTGSSTTWTLPTSDGAGWFQSDGSGNMSIVTTGITGATCSHWTNGICTAP